MQKKKKKIEDRKDSLTADENPSGWVSVPRRWGGHQQERHGSQSGVQ